MSNKSTATIATIGIDIGKNSFHVVGSNQRPDTLMQDRKAARSTKPLATHGRTIQVIRDLLAERSARRIHPNNQGCAGVRA
jgi:hypothetical protein